MHAPTGAVSTDPRHRVEEAPMTGSAAAFAADVLFRLITQLLASGSAS
ncbi:hypothetical protein IU433_03805 [Nocardia puris]|nr:hypothetical protein [Nocardia puris]MBF6209922.1 hypothetical protein [Nocardia puris]MBF6366494.1 hypothetical protein [Nocardia puris]MBF6458167.1 hypothetical protein [Nocardia puris]